jgi:hypothetical protein
VRVGSSVTLYINGALYGSGTGLAETLDASNGAFAIGNRIGSANYWSGLVSNFKVFNTALTAAQVADLYLNPEKIVPDGVADSALKLWLPMMEGAGTTAYDGSGNGNHGTISGATWVSGIGAPVAQTALVSWNKGVNEFTYSEQFDNAAWTKISTSVTANTLTAPDGQTTADSLNSTSSTEAIYQLAQVGVNSFSVYAKAGTTTSLQLASTTGFNGRGADFDLANGTAGAVYQVGSGSVTITGGTSAIESVGNGWYRCSINGLTLTAIRAVTIANNNGNLSYIWGASAEQASTAGPYVRTGATAQTSPVLLPQGLTANKDITGVNAFESARNPYALNLDGASWGEVHDNASLDIGSAITLEAWVRVDELGIYQVILEKGQAGIGSTRGFMLRVRNNNLIQITITGDNEKQITDTAIVQGDWTHLCVTKDDLYFNLYINGSYITQATNPTGSIDNEDSLLIGNDKTNGWQVNGSNRPPPHLQPRFNGYGGIKKLQR